LRTVNKTFKNTRDLWDVLAGQKKTEKFLDVITMVLVAPVVAIK
jgi:hypothetical protein